jgi:hypothetical protein
MDNCLQISYAGTAYFKNGHTCVKWPLKGGFLQVWQRKPVFWPFLEPYLQGIGATTPVVTGMAIN